MAMIAPTASRRSGPDLLARLGQVARDRELGELAARLGELHRWVAADMADFEAELASVPRGARAVLRAAHHLLDLDGKHLRPMCVVLAARLGSGCDERTRRLALAVELVHSATLLHDDVVDVGTIRRGAPAAREIYGNAASIFAGDWLLVEALRQIRDARVPGLLDDMLATIEQMILAESLQLEQRGRIDGSLADWFRVAEGKTAALFRWAMRAGALAGGLGGADADALERYGLHLGVAFQAIDDLLDLDGDPAATGKQLLSDLREGKLTYPLIVAVDRAPALAGLLERCAAHDPVEPIAPSAVRALLAGVRDTGALADCRDLAAARAAEAIAALSPFGDADGVRALVTVAEATISREA